MTKAQNRAYPIPDNPSPEGMICFAVYVPDDPLYIGEFWTAYQYFTKWVAWARGNDNKALLAAEAWKPAWELARQHYEAGERCIVLSDLQYRPIDGNPCGWEYTTDGGETWQVGFDGTDCNQPTDITVPAPYPDSTSGDFDAAASIINKLYRKLVEIMVSNCGDRDNAIAVAQNWLRQFDQSYTNPVALGNLYDAVCAADEPTQEYYQSDCAYHGRFTEISDCANVEGLFDWLNCMAEKVQDWLNDTSTAIQDALDAAVGSLNPDGWQNLAGYGGAGGSADFGSSCWQVVTFDAGSLAYSVIYGTEIAGGNPDDCLQSATFIEGGDTHSIARIHVDPTSVGILTGVDIDYYTFNIPSGTTIGLTVSHIRSGSVLTYEFIDPIAIDAWNTASIPIPNWVMQVGDLIRVEAGRTYNGTSAGDIADADATDVRMDNVKFYGLNLF